MCFLSFFIAICLSFPLYSATGKIVSLDPETNTFNYSDVEIPDHMIPKKKQGDPEYEQLPGWPQKIVGSGAIGIYQGVALADIDKDDTLEVIRPAGKNMYVYKHDGSLFWSKSILYYAQGAPAVADIDGDGYLEIAQTSRGLIEGGQLVLVDYLGNDLPGWPFKYENGQMFDSPVFSDMDGDSILEIIAGVIHDTIGSLHILNLDGSEININFPAILSEVPASTPAVGDMDNDGQKDIVICTNHSVCALGMDGNQKPGFPLSPSDSTKIWDNSPLLVDINGDKMSEIILITNDKPPGVYIYSHDGNILSNWPHLLNSNSYCSPTVVDPLSNGNFYIYAGCDGASWAPFPVVYGFNNDGTLLPHFPIEEIGGSNGFISVADIDNDNDFEILFDCNYFDSTDHGFLYAYNLDGSGLVPGFPLRPRGTTFLNGANLGDLNNDGILDLVAVSFSINDTIYINAWSLNVPYDPKKVLFDTFHGNNARDGFIPNPNITSIKAKNTESSSCPSVYIGGKYFSEISDVKIQFYSLQGRLIQEVPAAHYLKARRELARGVFVVNVVSKDKVSGRLRVANW